MFTNKEFWYGALFAVGATYAYHHWVAPLPGGAKPKA